ncbi:hypothetical protein [Yersinia ruckeri]|uniref:hypothetical protein n=1 Tax=Yersinia ruckeri TaxID=29486 RepID=UPI002238F9AF|nr:hypothetical protein [Yersinia ruckeri]MCW6598884.1 hypothetical protein [Yersinia ruckeri]
MKYIFIRIEDPDDAENVRELPFVFPNEVVHDDMFKVIKALPEFDNCKVTIASAGIYTPGNQTCTGISTSLGVSSRERDAEKLNMIDYTHGFI